MGDALGLGDALRLGGGKLWDREEGSSWIGRGALGLGGGKLWDWEEGGSWIGRGALGFGVGME